MDTPACIKPRTPKNKIHSTTASTPMRQIKSSAAITGCGREGFLAWQHSFRKHHAWRQPKLGMSERNTSKPNSKTKRTQSRKVMLQSKTNTTSRATADSSSGVALALEGFATGTSKSLQSLVKASKVRVWRVARCLFCCIELLSALRVVADWMHL